MTNGLIGGVFHWTGGIYKPNTHELECYHFLIDGNGKIHKGIYAPEDNIDCKDGRYAHHTGGGNTGRIAIAFCGEMNEAYPLKQIQIEAGCKLASELCKKYYIPINGWTTHMEFGEAHPDTTSHGKPDIYHLPCSHISGYKNVGNYLRSKIKWYYDKETSK